MIEKVIVGKTRWIDGEAYESRKSFTDISEAFKYIESSKLEKVTVYVIYQK